MKTSHLFFFSLIGSIAWADSIKSWVFYARVNESLLPLSGDLDPYDRLKNPVFHLSHGNASVNPTEFTLTEDNCAYGPNWEAIELNDPSITFGPATKSTFLHLDPNGKVLNGRFFSCVSPGDKQIRWIYYELWEEYRDQCIEVDIHLLPYTNASAVTGGEGENNIGITGVTNGVDSPWAFFAKPGERFIPLSQENEISAGISAFEDLSDVAEFKFQDGYAISIDQSGNEGMFSIFAFNRTRLKVDAQMRVLNSIYYSCASTRGKRLITDKILSNDCAKVEIYFLPYDRIKRSVSDSRLPEIKYISGSLSLPYVFFVIIEGNMVPLGARTYVHNGQNYSAMCYGRYVSDPVEFNMRGDYAFSMGTSNDGYVGIYDRTLVFGHTVPPTNLMLDENRKVRNLNYFSCWGFSNFRIITANRIFENCFEVDIYLLHHDLPKKEKNEKKVLEATSSPEELQDITFSPSVAKSLPYIFFAKLDGILLPLPSRVLPHYGKDLSVMFSHYETGEPTEFIMEGDYALSINTPTDGYFGIHENIAVFGPKTSRMKLILDADRKVMNFKFFSCWDAYNSEVISVERLSEYCNDVDLYFMHRHSGEPVLKPLNESISEKKLSGNMNLGETSRTSQTPSSDDLPYAFYVEINGVMFPVSAKTPPFFAPDVNVMFFALQPAPPAEFTLIDGEYVRSIRTPTNGFCGLYDNLLAFGPNITRSRFVFGDYGKVTNINFFSCWNSEISAAILTTESLNENCFRAEVYFLHYDPHSGNHVVRLPESVGNHGSKKEVCASL